MSEQAVARRYAEALFELAVEKDILSKVEEDLELVLQVLEASQDFQNILNSQRVPGPDKRDLLTQLFEGRLHEITMNFILVLTEKRRERYLHRISKEYIRLAEAKRNIVEAQVKTAVELTREDKQVLEQKLSESTGKNIKVVLKVDPELLGGAVIKIGDKVIDGSVARRLLKMKENLLS